MQFAKIENGVLVTAFAEDDDLDMQEKLHTDGFKEFVDDDNPPQCFGLQGVVRRYTEKSGKITTYFEVIDHDPEKVRDEIIGLQKDLESSDYMVIKVQEYSLAGQPCPYNIGEVHSDREQIRVRIRELESYLKD